ncbi:STAS domain-containing protein [Sphaerotilus uruguayifluvii]|uniref:Phospholipid transport system transporter-binding protein n=1 Tax=Sphaerotilus uruguayifluvii TaxID=2735897 RepID=A0ABX2G4K3_9BURK|nr:STAS domain-containing protein [Leptothrix sp. C29]NRT56950.1 phospholipid transport system transporter-binding protein [Leptothrix sp. C29]
MAAAATTLELPARLTLAEARAAVADLGARVGAAPAGGLLLVDAGPLGHFDSSALAVLLELQRRAAAAGRLLRIERVPARLAELAGLYGVAGLLGMASPA